MYVIKRLRHVLSMFSSGASLHSASKRRNASKTNLAVEQLEDRRLLAVSTWKDDPVDQNFNNSDNWQPVGPDPTREVEFTTDAGTVKVNNPITIQDLTVVRNTVTLDLGPTLKLSGHNLTVGRDDDATLVLTDQGKIETEGGDAIIGAILPARDGVLTINNGAQLDLTKENEHGSFTGTRGSVSVAGTINSGDASLGAGAISGGVFDAEVTATGVWNVKGDLDINDSGELFVNGGDVTVDETTIIDPEALPVDGTNAGKLRISNATMIMKKGATNSGLVTVENGGKIDTLAFTFTNSGRISTGGGIDKFWIDGKFTQTADGTMKVDIGGTQENHEFDKHDVYYVSGSIPPQDGKVTLAGELDVDLVGVGGGGIFDPEIDDVFSIVRAESSVTGTFDVVNLPELEGAKKLVIIYESSAAQRVDGEPVGLDDNTVEVLLKVVNDPDAEAMVFSNDAYGGLVVDYEIHSADSGYESDPFSIAIYKSDDGVNPTGSALQTVYVSNSADLTVGSHSAAISPTFYAQWGEHRLIAVVDSADVIDESDETNNVAELENSAFLAYGGTLSIYGDDLANTIEVTESGSNYLVDIDE